MNSIIVIMQLINTNIHKIIDLIDVPGKQCNLNQNRYSFAMFSVERTEIMFPQNVMIMKS